MKPFVGYNMATYWGHWLEMGKKLGDKAPKIFHVNWFRKDEDGHFIWPGFGENLRALLWALDRCEGKAEAVETPLGYVPAPGSLDLEGLEITDSELEKITTVDKETWKKELSGLKEWYAKFDHMPDELVAALAKLELDLDLD